MLSAYVRCPPDSARERLEQGIVGRPKLVFWSCARQLHRLTGTNAPVQDQMCETGVVRLFQQVGP